VSRVDQTLPMYSNATEFQSGAVARMQSQTRIIAILPSCDKRQRQRGAGYRSAAAGVGSAGRRGAGSGRRRLAGGRQAVRWQQVAGLALMA